jgi:hypothetical protein
LEDLVAGTAANSRPALEPRFTSRRGRSCAVEAARHAEHGTGEETRSASLTVEMDIEDRPDLNTGKAWSEMDLFDLANNVRLGVSIEETAEFLCRSRREVRDKIAALRQTGELDRRVAEANGAPGIRE